MLAALGTVVVTSLSGVMMPGPMFAVTLAKSLKSPWAGVMVSLGHAVVEVPIILLVYFGLANFFQHEIVRLVLSVLGGGMIIWMGIDLFRARRRLAREGRDTSYNAFVAGILMSGLNPFFLVWWVTVGSLLLMNFLGAVGVWGLPLFIIVHWLCDLVWLSIVSVTIYKTHSFWGERVQEGVFIVLSLALLYFGAQFIVRGLSGYLEAGLTSAIIIVGLALVWLFREAGFTRVKLAAGQARRPRD
ncbi:MAG: LysE family translocator [Dehalococcoidales bacterium]|nr:LysE family translocator [Dehalococcoidales bacterium]